jgi:hypothetical protein
MKNFGEIYEAINNNVNLILNKKNKLNECILLIKNNDILLNEWHFYNQLFNEENVDQRKDFIKESINEFKQYSSDDIKKANEKLNKAFDKLKLSEDVKHAPLYAILDKLITEKYNIKNINTKLKYIDEAHTYMINEKIEPKTIVEENEYKGDKTLLLNIMIQKFNRKYGEKMNESEKDLFKKIISAKSNDDKHAIYNEVKNDCLTQLNGLIKESEDIDVKEKFLTLKEQLLNESFNKDNYLTDIYNILEKKSVLDEISDIK